MTLTETAVFTKKALVFAVFIFIFLLLCWGAYAYYIKFIYKPPVIEEIPNLNFGVLPRPNLPKTITDSSSFTYTLDTATGSVPTDTPKVFKVYSIAQLATDLLALDRAKDLSVNLGFNRTPQMLNSTEYRFLSDKGGDLTINLDTGNFRYERPLATDSANLDNRESFLKEARLSQQFKSYLSQKSLLKKELEDGKTKVEYNINKFSAKISLWQEDIDKTPIVTGTFSEGLIKAIVSQQSEEAKKYILLDYIFWPIDLENFATYPLKKADEALKNLESGNGTVITSPKSSAVSVTKIYLAYLLTKDYTPYLEPVFVFEGTDFVAYVPAVTDKYLEKTN